MIYCISYHVLYRVNYCICNSSICPRPVLYKVLNNIMCTEYTRYRVKNKTCNNSTCRTLAHVIPTPPQLSKITPTTCQIGTQNTSLPSRVLKSLLNVFVFKITICLGKQEDFFSSKICVQCVSYFLWLRMLEWQNLQRKSYFQNETLQQDLSTIESFLFR